MGAVLQCIDSRKMRPRLAGDTRLQPPRCVETLGTLGASVRVQGWGAPAGCGAIERRGVGDDGEQTYMDTAEMGLREESVA